MLYVIPVEDAPGAPEKRGGVHPLCKVPSI